MRKIILIIDTAGNSSIEAVGFKGRSCTQATEALERALGTVGPRQFKPDFYRSQTVQNEQPLGKPQEG